MSSKLNVCEIISGHIATLRDSSTNKLSIADVFTFFVIPILFSILSIICFFDLTNDLISLLVNFGAIFTALLLSVLVLVYDQSSKLTERNQLSPVAFFDVKKLLLKQLYYNICYSIILSVNLVVFCFIESIARGFIINIHYPYILKLNLDRYLIVPIIIFIAIHLILNIIMIVKRMHALLTTE